MKLQALKCPNCDASLEIEDGIDTFFCKYCGYKIYLDGMSDASINAKVQIKSMAHQEKMKIMQYEQERYKMNKKEQHKKWEAKKSIIITVFSVVAFVLFYAIFFCSMERKSIKEEEKLQAIVDEIMIDIANEDFNEAYIKAQSIKHTNPWSDEVEQKWETTRKEVINQIIEAEKEATGSSSHKPEKDGLFDDWFD